MTRRWEIVLDSLIDLGAEADLPILIPSFVPRVEAEDPGKRRVMEE